MIAQLRHGEDTDTDLLERVLVANLDDTLRGKDFFIRKALGWAPRVTLDEGLDRTIEHVRAHIALYRPAEYAR